MRLPRIFRRKPKPVRYPSDESRAIYDEVFPEGWNCLTTELDTGRTRNTSSKDWADEA